VTRSARRNLFAIGATIFGLLLGWGLLGLPKFGGYEGPYGVVLSRVGVQETRATNIVGAVTFDYRGFDTLGEEFILFAAVMGVALLLRAQREEEEAPPEDQAQYRRPPHDSDAVRELCLGLVAPTALFGMYVVTHGHLSPGGGFQGGVILATAPLLMYLGGEYKGLRRLSPETLIEAAEGAGAGGYVLVATAGLAAGAAFMHNFLPLGSAGDLLSSGTILVLNLTVGLAVAAGFVLLLSEFLEQTLELRRRSKTP
jgi:multicomponent Na+:H+ antiporter subunit B